VPSLLRGSLPPPATQGAGPPNSRARAERFYGPRAPPPRPWRISDDRPSPPQRPGRQWSSLAGAGKGARRWPANEASISSYIGASSHNGVLRVAQRPQSFQRRLASPAPHQTAEARSASRPGTLLTPNHPRGAGHHALQTATWESRLPAPLLKHSEGRSQHSLCSVPRVGLGSGTAKG